MRYPRWGPGGAHARTTHTPLPPQTPSPPHRLTAPRCGTHGGARAAHTPAPLTRHYHHKPPLPPTVLPHPDAVPTVGPGRRTRPHHSHVTTTTNPLSPQPSYRTPMRYPRWGPGGAHARTTHTSLPPQTPSPPHRHPRPRSGTHPSFSSKRESAGSRMTGDVSTGKGPVWGCGLSATQRLQYPNTCANVNSSLRCPNWRGACAPKTDSWE